MKKSLAVWLGLLALFAIIVVFSFRGKEASQNNSYSSRERLLAPNFSLELLSGKRIQLSSLRSKVVLLNFSASW